MQEPALPAALYDFLYKDADRIASYYAQLFQGKLLSTERTTSDKNSQEKSGKVNAGVVTGDMKTTSEVQNTLREVVDPHDRAVNDVLAYLRENGLLLEDVDNAPPGSIVLAKGVLSFVDGMVLRMVAESVANMPASLFGFTDGDENTALIRVVLPMIGGLELPSIFLLQSETSSVTGTLKPQGLQEPISSYYFKQGESGLGDVYIIGIKDNITPTNASLSTGLFGITKQFAEALSQLVMPSDAYRVVPLAMFRVLS